MAMTELFPLSSPTQDKFKEREQSLNKAGDALKFNNEAKDLSRRLGDLSDALNAGGRPRDAKEANEMLAKLQDAEEEIREAEIARDKLRVSVTAILVLLLLLAECWIYFSALPGALRWTERPGVGGAAAQVGPEDRRLEAGREGPSQRIGGRPQGASVAPEHGQLGLETRPVEAPVGHGRPRRIGSGRGERDQGISERASEAWQADR